MQSHNDKEGRRVSLPELVERAVLVLNDPVVVAAQHALNLKVADKGLI
jgi:hypothetical protein